MSIWWLHLLVSIVVCLLPKNAMIFSSELCNFAEARISSAYLFIQGTGLTTPITSGFALVLNILTAFLSSQHCGYSVVWQILSLQNVLSVIRIIY